MHLRIGIRHGLPSRTVYSITQDDQGFMWFGTARGAVRFDGTQAKVYGIAEGLPDQEVFATVVDSRERHWFLTSEGSLAYLAQGFVHHPGNDSTLAKVRLRSGIRSFIEDHEGSCWFGGLNGEVACIRADGSTSQHIKTEPWSGIQGGYITLHRNEVGEAVVFNGTFRVHPEPPDPVDRTRPPPEGRVFRSLDGRLLLTTRDAVLEFIQAEWRTLVTTAELGIQGSFRRVFSTGGGELWAALEEGGLIRLRERDGTWCRGGTTIFAPDFVNDVIRDKDGNLWVSTAYDGVIFITAWDERSVFLTGVRGPQEEFLRLYADTLTGVVWAGTNQGDLYRVSNTMELVDLPPSGPQFSRVNSIERSTDHLLVATDKNTLRIPVRPDASLGKEKSLMCIWPDGTWSHTGMKAFTVGPEDEVYGSFYGLFRLDQDSSFLRPMISKRIPVARIYAPCLDNKGVLWFEDEGHLRSMVNGKVMEHPTLMLRPGVRITHIAPFGDTLLVASSGQGVILFHDERVVGTITMADGLSSDVVNRVSSLRGDVFVATVKGADQIQWRGRGKPVVFTYPLSTSLPDAHDIVATDEHVLVAFANGLCRMPRGQVVYAPQHPAVYLEKVFVNGVAVNHTRPILLHQGDDRLSVEVGMIRYGTLTPNAIEYRIGRDQSWMTSEARVLEFPLLEAGRLALEVRAKGSKDSPPVSLALQVVPPWYARWWVRVVFALLVIGAVMLVLHFLAQRRLRAATARAKRRELITQERQRIAMDLHDDLGAELSSLLLLVRVSRQRGDDASWGQVETLAASLTEKMDEVIWTTDPGHDTVEATLMFLQRHVATVCARHGLRSRVLLEPELKEHVMSAGMRSELLHIAKEVLNNTVKHAGASTFSIHIQRSGDQLAFRFMDDGRWLVGHARGEGRGLHQVKERAERIGARLNIVRTEQVSLCVEVLFPIALIGRMDDAPIAPTA